MGVHNAEQNNFPALSRTREGRVAYSHGQRQQCGIFFVDQYGVVMSAYTEKFKSPKWQKKRLEALEYYSFLCCSCEEKEKELHVHHRHYIKGRQPWEYEIDDLVVLCSDCHKTWHDAKEQIDIIIGNITDNLPLLTFPKGCIILSLL